MWLNENFMLEIKEEREPVSIIIQGTYEFIEEINKYLMENLTPRYKECTIINCYEVYDTNHMLYNILNNHDYVFNTGGLHPKEEIFPDYKPIYKLESVTPCEYKKNKIASNNILSESMRRLI